VTIRQKRKKEELGEYGRYISARHIRSERNGGVQIRKRRHLLSFPDLVNIKDLYVAKSTFSEPPEEGWMATSDSSKEHKIR